MADRDDLGHYMEATARMRERAEKAEAERDLALASDAPEIVQELRRLRAELADLRERNRVLEDDTNRDGFSVLHGPGDTKTVPLAQANRKLADVRAALRAAIEAHHRTHRGDGRYPFTNCNVQTCRDAAAVLQESGGTDA